MISTITATFRADFFDRARRRNFLVVLLGMAILSMLAFPNSEAAYATVEIHGYRGIYNSAWVGATLAILNVCFLPIICFYLIKNAIEKDRQRMIGELLAATELRKTDYIVGKWLSNIALLMVIIVVMTVTAAFVQLWHGESYQINLLELILPQLILVLPILALISALAILFETVTWLRGGLGNIAYFFLWVGLLIRAVEDASGIGTVLEQMTAAVVAYDPNNTGGVSIGIKVGESAQLKTFPWQGIEYNAGMFNAFFYLLAVCPLILALAVGLFDRFKKSADHNCSPVNTTGFASRLNAPLAMIGHVFEHLTARWSFTRLVRQEYLLLIRGASNWWYLVLIVLGLMQLVLPLENVRMAIIPISWILCVLTFSQMGMREKFHGADSLIFSCPSPIKKQFPAMLLAGFMIALLVVSPALLRFLLIDQGFSALMLLVGALFIPSLAIACGALTQTSRTFEVLFTAIWYIGPLQKTPLDFVGVEPIVSQQAGAPLAFAIASLLLLAAGLQGRWMQAK